jgi:hypothetical protein
MHIAKRLQIEAVQVIRLFWKIVKHIICSAVYIYSFREFNVCVVSFRELNVNKFRGCFEVHLHELQD